MKATTSNSQPLLWVNHDAKNRKARPHRRVVFSHVQNSFKKWKRQEDAVALRKSSQVPGTRLTDATQPVLIQHGDQNALQLADGLSKEERLHEDRLRTITGRVRPQIILGNGNSDPFQSFAIPIDVRLAELLIYTRDMYLPEIFTHVNAADVKAAVTSAMDETLTFLHDTTTAYAHIAKIAAVMPKESVASELATQIPTFKLKGLASLRKRLMDPKSLQDASTSATMLLFLTAELYEGNLDAAATHGNMIAHVLQTGLIPLNFLFLFSSLYDDTQRACFALSRPAFDVKMWVPQQLGPLGTTIVEKVAYRLVTATCGPIETSIKSSAMRNILAEANYCSAIALLMSKTEDQVNTDNQATFRFGCRRLACIGTIINHYIDSREKMKQRQKSHINVLRNARMEAQICLGLLYLMRREAKMDMFWVKTRFGVFSEHRNILANLQELLQQDDLKFEGKYARVRLFGLFVGAWAAYANESAGVEYAVVEKEWFDSEFAAQAVMMRLWTWNTVENVLKGFHFLNFMQPNGSTFWKTMNPWDTQDGENMPIGDKVS
jgi:hypothetical protein